jgi:DNA helicase II / ATP-dependent DNA helicase PcrA
MKNYVLKPLNTVESCLPDSFAEELNDAQREAVFFGEGPLLIIAGAGSGKTKTLVYRVARLVSMGVDPAAILLLTFTRKSSEEMLRRAAQILDSRCQNVSGGTFHSFCNLVLRRYSKLLGFNENFTILDRTDSEEIIQSIRKELNLNKTEKRFPKKNAILAVIGKAVNMQKTVESVLVQEYPHFYEFEKEINQINSLYFKYKEEMQVFDYDDLLCKVLQLLRDFPDIREQLQNSFEYIMVDEYQDTNAIQAGIIKYLTNKKLNVTVVGDDSQSIYSFRGANFKNIMSFPNSYPDTKVITLEENYRSTQPVLDLTNAVIEHSKEKYSKNLFTRNKATEKPVYVETDSENMQSQFVCQKILELREAGVPLNEIAVLIRSGWHSNALEVELKARNIPFVKHGGFKFMETAHIKDVVSFFRVIFNRTDTISWQRILLMLDGVGPQGASNLIKEIINNNGALNFGKYKSKAYFKPLTKIVDIIYNSSAEGIAPSELISKILKVYQPLFKNKYDDYHKREQDLESLKVIAEKYTEMAEFLSDMTLDPPDGSQLGSEPENEDEEKMVISTIHSAKGLEWHTVFLISAVDGYLPSFQSLNDQAQIEEERRLLYVALTRAREKLFIIKPNLDNSASNYYRYQGMQFSKISRFLSESNIIDNFADKWAIVDERPKKPRYSSTFSYLDDSYDDMPSVDPSRKRYNF